MLSPHTINTRASSFKISQFDDMVAWMTILGLLSVSWTIPSTLLSFLIYKYIWSKPPGHQSLLDLVIAEYLILSITRNIITVVYHGIGILHGPIDPNVANFLYFMIVQWPRIEISSIQAILMIKALLIFKGKWMADFTDSDVLWLSRRFIVVYSSLAFILDYHQSPKSYPALTFLAGTDINS